jgi:leader peptidase (prepilin peptidase)/N-methyltransferase
MRLPAPDHPPTEGGQSLERGSHAWAGSPAAGRNETRELARLRPIAGLVLVALAVACVATFGLTIEALVDTLACGVLVAVTVTDLEQRIVPNRIIVPALVVALIVQTLRDPSVEWIVASLAAGGFYFLAALIYPAGIGMGDVKLAAFLGAWLGAPVIVALFAGSLLATIPAVVILATRGKAGRKVGIPFAPFLAAGAVIALFFGDSIIDAWLG